MKTQNPTHTTHASSHPVSYDFKGLADWYEIFEGGEQKASNGKIINLSEADLDQVIDNSQGRDIPLVIGHPKAADPAYGWSNEYMREGLKLFTRSHSFADEFSEAVQHKHFPKRSVSLEPSENGGLQIRHIGFLGAVPPAVKTLTDIEFEQSDQSLTFDFSMSADERREVGFSFKNIAGYFRRLKNNMIEKTSLEEADKLMPEWELDGLEETARSIRQPEPPAHTHSFSETTSTDNTGDTTVTPEEIEALKQRNVELEADAKKREAKLAQKEKEHNFAAAKTAAAELITPLIAEGKLLPANTKGDALVNFMAQLKTLPTNDSTFEFSEGEDDQVKQVEVSLYDFAETLLKSLNPQIKLGREGSEAADETNSGSSDFHGHEVDSEKLLFTQKAEALAVDKNISFAAAVSQLSFEQET